MGAATPLTLLLLLLHAAATLAADAADTTAAAATTTAALPLTDALLVSSASLEEDSDRPQGDSSDDGDRPSPAACTERLAAACGQGPAAGGGGGGRGGAQRRPLCGTDGVTYPSRCHLLRVQCKGVAVAVKHKGPCKESRPCWTDRRHAQLIPRPPQVQLFEPRCLDDGSYAPVQCHGETGYCWCVTPHGRAVPNTSRRHKRPNCGRWGKAGTRRRSSPGGRKHKKGCSRNERSIFVNSLLHHFRAEYSRLPGAAAVLAGAESGSSEGAAASERAVLAWKFSSTDRDGDGMLGRGELAALRRLVRKAVPPRRCARLFPLRLCDRDDDRRLSREEWSACLGLDFNHESHSEGPAAPSKEGEWKKNLTTRALLRHTLSQLKVVRRNSSQILQGRMSAGPGFGDDSLDTKEEPEAYDCLSDRKTVLDEQGSSGLYIPECTPDGRYKKIQCYNSTGYCWCVYEDSGIVIPGTSVKDQKPNCDVVPPPKRPMSGCPEPQKQAFLRNLMEYLKKVKLSSKDKSVPESSSSNSGSDDAIASWAFQTWDKNRNKMWERKEWKNFRNLITQQQSLKRCGKRLPRYCDVNNDQKISLTEWLNCIKNPHNNTGVTTEAVTSQRRTGEANPLLIYLKP